MRLAHWLQLLAEDGVEFGILVVQESAQIIALWLLLILIESDTLHHLVHGLVVGLQLLLRVLHELLQVVLVLWDYREVILLLILGLLPLKLSLTLHLPLKLCQLLFHLRPLADLARCRVAVLTLLLVGQIVRYCCCVLIIPRDIYQAPSRAPWKVWLERIRRFALSFHPLQTFSPQ